MPKKQTPRNEHPEIDYSILDPLDDDFGNRLQWFDRIRAAIQSLRGDNDEGSPRWKTYYSGLGWPMSGTVGVIPDLETIISGLKKCPQLFPLFENDLLFLIQRFRETGPVDHPGGPYLCRDGVPDDRAMVLQLISLVDRNQSTRVGHAVRVASRKPRVPRRDPVLMSYIRKNRRKGVADVWRMLMKYNDDSPLRVRGGEMLFNRGCLEIHTTKGKRVFTYKKFREYFRACKNPPTRTR